MKKTTLLFCLALSASLHSAAQTTYTQDFDALTSSLPEGWEAVETTVGFSYGGGIYEIGRDYDLKGEGRGRSLYTYQTTYAGYIITPEVTGNVSFYTRPRQSRKACGVRVFRYSSDGVGEEIAEAARSWNSGNTSTSWQQVNFPLSGGTRLAFQLNNACVDDFEAQLYTVSEGADLRVTDDAGHAATALDFGFAEADATTELTLSNPGTVALQVNITATEGLSVTPTSATIAPEESVVLTVTFKATTPEGRVTITPSAASGLEAVKVAVRGTVRDASKFHEDFSSGLPEDWETVATGSSSSSGEWTFADGWAEYAYGSNFGRYYDQALVSPLMLFTAEETLFFLARSAGNVTPYLAVEYFDGTSWQPVEEGTVSHLNADPAYYTATIPAGATRIRFNGCGFAVGEVYGGRLDTTPRARLAVDGIDDGGTLSWGYTSLPQGSEQTITLRNDGKADLKVTFTATGGYTLSAASATVEAGGTFDLILATPAADGPGVLTITPDQESGLAAYTINLMSYYKVPRPVMSVASTPIAFGALTETASQDVSVSNSGDATLVATIESDNGLFAVSPSTLHVAPGESQTFSVTYLYTAGTYGHATATITITPNDGNVVKLTASASAKNPDVWSEDFEDGIPSVWVNDGWTLASGPDANSSQMAYASTSAGTRLTTPRLQAAAGDVLTFEAYMPWSGDVLTVEYSTDEMSTWNDALEYIPEEDATYEILSFTAPADGFYYLRFTGRYNYIDNLEGFRLALPEHQVVMGRTTMPSSGNQHVAYTASVSLTEKIGREEEVTVRLLVDDEAVATASQTLAANSTATLSLTYTPTQPQTGAMACVEVIYAGGTLRSTATPLTVAAALLLDEDVASVLEEGTYPAAELHLTLAEGWNTICLPFAVPDVSVFGSDVEAYRFSHMTENGLAVFSPTTSLGNGSAYLLHAGSAHQDFVLHDAVIFSFTLEAGSAQHGGVTFQGTYAPVAAGDLTGNLIVGADGRLQAATETDTLQGFRAFFLPAGDTLLRGISTDGITTALRLTKDSLDSKGAARQTVYDLTGRPVSPARRQHGICITGGRKAVVR